MNYLTLCQRTRQRGGMSGAGPSQITGQTGEMARVVDWVRQAWLDLQTTRTPADWRPLWRQLGVSVAAGEDSVTAPSDLGHVMRDRFRWSGGHLHWYAWRDFPRGEAEPGTPVAITRRPDGALMLWPTPAVAGNVSGEYYARTQALEQADDEPWLPDHLQDAIIYQALVYYAAYEDAPEIYQDASTKVQQYLQRMNNELLDDVALGGPLA